MQDHVIQHQIISKAVKFAAVQWQWIVDVAKA